MARKPDPLVVLLVAGQLAVVHAVAERDAVQVLVRRIDVEDRLGERPVVAHVLGLSCGVDDSTADSPRPATPFSLRVSVASLF